MVTLGGVDLSMDILQSGLISEPSVAYGEKVTLDGTVYSYNQVIDRQNKIVIFGNADMGWITYQSYKDLLVLCQDINAVYTLDFHGDVREVMFDYSEPPVIEMEAIVQRPYYSDGDYFYGSIKLLEV